MCFAFAWNLTINDGDVRADMERCGPRVSFFAEGGKGVDAGGAVGGEVAGEKCYAGKDGGNGEVGDGVGWGYVEEHGAEESRHDRGYD
jgi:hypothetical protein